MVIRHCGDFSCKTWRSSFSNEELSALLEDPRQRDLAVMGPENSSSKNHRRRSFHGLELKQVPDRKPVSVVGLGCWAPSQSKGTMKATKQHARHRRTLHSFQPGHLLKLFVGDEPSSSHGYGKRTDGHVNSSSHGYGKRTDGHVNSELHAVQSTSGTIETLEDKDSPGSSSPQESGRPVPGSFAKDVPQSKSTQHPAHNKPSGRQQQQGLKDVQNAIHHLSSQLKRMDLDEILVPTPSQYDGAADMACRDDVMHVSAHQRRMENMDMEKSNSRCSSQVKREDTHRTEFVQRGSRRAHSHHRIHQNRRHNDSTEQKLSGCLDESMEHDERCSHDDGSLHVFSVDDIRAPLFEKVALLKRDALDVESLADVGSIELEIISSLRKEVRITENPALGEVPNLDNTDYSSLVLPISEPGQGSITADALHFSESLISFSDVCSPSSTDSSQLSEALQNVSGRQANLEVKNEKPLSKFLQGQQAKQTRDQFSQTNDIQERAGCDKDVLLPCIDNSGHPHSLSDCKKALSWLYQQDNTSQRSTTDGGPTSVPTRFGTLLFSLIPCEEGMQMMALESLFHETIKVARSFLRVLSSHVFAPGKEFFSEEFFYKQGDDEKSAIQNASLPNIRLAHQSHMGFGVQAVINELIYDQFDKPTYCGHRRSVDRCVLLVEFERLATLAPLDAINPYSDVYSKCFHKLCSTKLELLMDKFFWLKDWPDHYLLAFTDAMKYVWQAHLIAQASINAISMLKVTEWSSYDSSVMQVVAYDHNVAEFINKVQFMISPGFRLQGSMVKCEVYLMPKTQQGAL